MSDTKQQYLITPSLDETIAITVDECMAATDAICEWRFVDDPDAFEYWRTELRSRIVAALITELKQANR